MISILRPTRDTGLLTAEVFEELFQRHLGAAFTVRRVPLAAWCTAVFGRPDAPLPLDEAARHFARETRGATFLAPNFECIPLAPALLALRNRARVDVRLLLISHATAAYALEWALLRPLLAPGDVIVAPSESACRAIELLCPALTPYLHVASHPMEPLPGTAVRNPRRVVSMGRIHAGKLLHRQIDAMACLRARGRPLPAMEIAGALDDGGWPGGGPHAYARSLQERIRRLRLGDHVRLVGPIRGAEARGAFLASAGLLVNLSVTLEESFPKTPVEALGAGAPVLGTAWNGLHETVGRCGTLLPLSIVGAGLGTVDVEPEAVADAMERLLADSPSGDACRAHAARFRPELAVARYRAVLEGAAETRGGPGEMVPWPASDEPVAPLDGLLAVTAPITNFSWREAFALHAAACARARATWEGDLTIPLTDGERLRGLTDAALRPSVERFYASLPPLPAAASTDVSDCLLRHRRVGSDSFVARIAAAARHSGLLGGRLACLAEVVHAGRGDLVAAGVACLENEGARGPGMAALRAEVALLAGDYEMAYHHCTGALYDAPATEHEAPRVRQVAKIARRWECPALALPWLTEWLARFPDAQESGPVWLELAVTTLYADEGNAAPALAQARALLGPIPIVEKVERMVAARLAPSALV